MRKRHSPQLLSEEVKLKNVLAWCYLLSVKWQSFYGQRAERAQTLPEPTGGLLPLADALLSRLCVSAASTYCHLLSQSTSESLLRPYEQKAKMSSH